LVWEPFFDRMRELGHEDGQSVTMCAGFGAGRAEPILSSARFAQTGSVQVRSPIRTVTAINAYAASHCISAVIASSFASFCIVFTVETRVYFMTGLIFKGRVDARYKFEFGPLNSQCRKLDASTMN
jgi:hypothetical protein